jgi:MYXO-CTERM domain-containing protein
MGKLRRGEVSAWHKSEVAEVLRALDTDAESGLSDKEAARRLAEQGPNELEEKGGRGPWALFAGGLAEHLRRRREKALSLAASPIGSSVTRAGPSSW